MLRNEGLMGFGRNKEKEMKKEGQFVKGERSGIGVVGKEKEENRENVKWKRGCKKKDR